MYSNATFKNNKIALDCLISFYSKDAPWICLILPFGMKVDVAHPFLDYFCNQFNIITYESRLILDLPSRQVVDGELTVESHVKDLMALLSENKIESAILVGYCSGSGIALAAANQSPNTFSQLILVNGEFALLDDRECVTQYGTDIDNLLPIAAMDRSKAEFILERLQSGTASANSDVPAGVNLPFSQTHFFHRYAINYLSYRAADFEALARSINTKTLIIAGKKDKQTNESSALKINKAIKKSQLYIDPLGDHYGLIRQNSTTLEYIYSYLDMELANAI